MTIFGFCIWSCAMNIFHKLSTSASIYHFMPNFKIILFVQDHLLAYTIFQSIRAVFLSTTGAVITLPYCYCNSEVRKAISTRWDMITKLGFKFYFFPSSHWKFFFPFSWQDKMMSYKSLILFQMAALEDGEKCWIWAVQTQSQCCHLHLCV